MLKYKFIDLRARIGPIAKKTSRPVHALLTAMAAGSAVTLAAVPGFAGPTPYNVHAIYTAGTPFKTGGLDSYGSAFVAGEIRKSVSYHGSTFTFGPANAPDGWSNTTVALTPGSYKTLNIVGCSSGGIGSTQTFTVNYKDGTQTAFIVSMKDWVAKKTFPGETKVVTTAHYIKLDGTVRKHNMVLHGYTIKLNGKPVVSVTLPKTRGVVILGVKGR